MQQFFIDDINSIKLNSDQIHQCKKVLRMKVGDRIRVVDQERRGLVVEIMDREFTRFKTIKNITFPKRKGKVRLIISLIRNDALELTIQKATELGVDEIAFYEADRGVVRGYKNPKRKFQRFESIAKEAAEQSYQNRVPKILGIYNRETIGQLKADQSIIADFNREERLENLLTDSVRFVQILIGPEGGFTNDERKFFQGIGYNSLSLCQNILRAETAGIISVFKVFDYWGTIHD